MQSRYALRFSAGGAALILPLFTFIDSLPI
jgi:hypothetical protein